MTHLLDVISPADSEVKRPPSTRQKSCNTCVRGKRRCDKRMPRCTRCAAKNLDCVYRRHPAHPKGLAAHVDSSSASASSGSTPELFDFDAELNTCLESLGDPTSNTMASPEDLQQQQQQQQVELQPDPTYPDLNFSLADLLGEPITSGPWDMDGEACGKTDLPVPLGPGARPAIRDLSLFEEKRDCFQSVDAMHVSDPRSKLGFIVHELSTMHTVFAQTRSTPFMHPRLYAKQLPAAVLVSFSAASSYAHRTPETRGWTMKMMQYAIREVYREGSGATTAAERLARQQALLLLNSIRVFDGDVGMRAAAEREMSVMLAWTRELMSAREELEEMMGERQPKTWESWILLESMRRTLIMTFAMIFLISLLKNGHAPCFFWQDQQSYTASRHLWDAQSSVDFFWAWREKPRYCVTNLDFKEFWKYGRAEDMDEFTRVMLTPMVGIDAVEHFMTGEVSIPV